MPEQQEATAVPARLTARLLQAGLTIKNDLQKGFAAWEENFRDPVKAALMARPAGADQIVSAEIGGVRVFLAKTFPKDTLDVRRVLDVLLTANAAQITGADIRQMLETGVLVVAKPEAVIAVLASRLPNIRAQDFVVPAANPAVPTRVDLKWQAVAGHDGLAAAAAAGPLADLVTRVQVAAAGASSRVIVAAQQVPAAETPAAALRRIQVLPTPPAAPARHPRARSRPRHRS